MLSGRVRQSAAEAAIYEEYTEYNITLSLNSSMSSNNNNAFSYCTPSSNEQERSKKKQQRKLMRQLSTMSCQHDKRYHMLTNKSFPKK